MGFDILQSLLGKTIERIDRPEHDEFLLVKFSDNTLWLVKSKRWNAAGSKLGHKVDKKHEHDK